ncbi:36.4 kDa proline-rich protein-like [Phoenix dactylifera]|uniref:36.4 kDa proline-rich protein-like n=1 Tax=Phoenix dactylifera TaxID=42345 RepID=A0A8B9AQM3_PHODC|nr:36.4 kDa proline-rich protein-like [Phoenix dactylifera]
MTMDSSKRSALLLTLMLFISSLAPIVAGGRCPDPPTTKPRPPKSKHHKTKPPKAKTPKAKPPKGHITHPPIIVKPPITYPPVVRHPPSTPPAPIIVKPPITYPPVVRPPPSTPPGTGNTPCPPPPPPAPATCPADSLKLGACVDLLGGLVHIGIGDPVANQCCPLLQGLVEIEAAVCLCTTIKLKLLNINIYLPLALQLLLTCGKTPPPGYTCTI